MAGQSCRSCRSCGSCSHQGAAPPRELIAGTCPHVTGISHLTGPSWVCRCARCVAGTLGDPLQPRPSWTLAPPPTMSPRAFVFIGVAGASGSLMSQLHSIHHFNTTPHTSTANSKQWISDWLLKICVNCQDECREMRSSGVQDAPIPV